MKTEQQSLELNSDKKSSNPWFLEVRRRNLIRFLAGGVIGPRHVIAKYRVGDILGLSDESVLLFKNGFSLSELEGLAEEADSHDIPALLEIDQEFAEKHLSADFLTSQSKDLITMPFVASMNAISAIHFQSDEDRVDFRARQFENVAVDKFSTAVSPELFSFERKVALKDQVATLESDKAVSSESLVSGAQQADRLIGGIAMLAHTLPRQNGWVSAFSQVLSDLPKIVTSSDERAGDTLEIYSRFNRALLESLGDLTGAPGNLVDESLLLSTMLAIVDSDIHEGWNAEEFLAKVVGQVKERDAEDPEGGLEKWHDFCLRVLRNEVDIPRSVFADERDVVRRAIFLLLLRPDPDAVVASMESGLKAGASVRALAALLSGMHIGFEGLSNRYKADRKRYEGLSELKSWLINSLWKGRDAANEFHGAAPAVKTKRESYKSAGLVGRAKISLNEFEIAEVLLELPVALREVWNRAEGVGLQMEFDEDHERLVVHYKDNEDSTYDVYVTDLAGQGSDRLVRFWTPCFDVSTPSKLKKLTKGKALSLLQHNGAPSTHARFALDDGRGAIIAAVDQVAATMQKEELRSHLSSVVRLLSWFESNS